MNKICYSIKHDEAISVCFVAGHPEVMAIGENMSEINEEAYMNGYNWEVFIEAYLTKNKPELLEGLEPDPEAGAYYANYELNSTNEKKAAELVELLIGLVSNEETILEFVRTDGDNIEWD